MQTHDHVIRPEFATAVRGYDRTQVDDYLGRLHEWVAEWQLRATTAEEAATAATGQLEEARRRLATLELQTELPVPGSMAILGERVGEILHAAVAAAEELRAGMEAELRELRATAESERTAMLAAAREEAAALVEEAREREHAIADDVAGLAAKRAAAVDDLSQLQRRLAELVGPPADRATDGSGDDAPPVRSGR